MLCYALMCYKKKFNFHCMYSNFECFTQNGQTIGIGIKEEAFRSVSRWWMLYHTHVIKEPKLLTTHDRANWLAKLANVTMVKNEAVLAEPINCAATSINPMMSSPHVSLKISVDMEDTIENFKALITNRIHKNLTDYDVMIQGVSCNNEETIADQCYYYNGKAEVHIKIDHQSKIVNIVDIAPTYNRPLLVNFIYSLLNDPANKDIICWVNERDGIFKITNKTMVAKAWGVLKNKPDMNYDTMSRALRYYYRRRLMKKVPGKRFEYG